MPSVGENGVTNGFEWERQGTGLWYFDISVAWAEANVWKKRLTGSLRGGCREVLGHYLIGARSSPLLASETDWS